MHSKPLMKITLHLLAVLLLLPLTHPACENRACFPPSPDLVMPGSGRSVTASSNCGDPPSTSLYQLSETVELCNASDPDHSHPVEDLYDFSTLVAGAQYNSPVLRTWWQSQNGTKNVVLTALMGDTFLFQTTRVIFRSLRPASVIIEKTEDSGGTWQPLRYYAQSCPHSFPGVAHLSSDVVEGGGGNVVSGCIEKYYYGDDTTFDSTRTFQEVLYNPVSELGGGFYREQVFDYFRFTGLRLTLVEPGDTASGRDHFAVSDWSITGHCLCYGHAERCIGESEAVCDCEHNTMGKHCELCLPLYNNRPWAAARLRNANQCQDCGCDGRASSCTYDQLKGYGVCDNCTENSAGDKCDHCIEDYYINPGLESFSDYCVACNCSSVGAVPGTWCNETSGQCVCKANVQGRQCDECRDSYFNLRQSNSDGCEVCNCDPRGTLGSPNFCDKLTGQCICKENVQGSRCNECKPGHFNLSLSDSAGCTPCDCDIGGALLNGSCDSDTGACECKPNIVGRSCQDVDEGFFLPPLDGIKIEAESIPVIPSGVTVEQSDDFREFLLVTPSITLVYPDLTVPRTQRYEVVVRYEASSLWTNNTLFLTTSGNNTLYSCQDGIDMSQPDLLHFDLNQTESLVDPVNTTSGIPGQSACPQVLGLVQGHMFQTFCAQNGNIECPCPETLTSVPPDLPSFYSNSTPAAAASVGEVCLAAGVAYQPVFSSSSQADGILAVDAMILLPLLDDVPLYALSGNTSSLIEVCWEEAMQPYSNLRDSEECSSIEFSIMAELYDGATGCDCDVNGSLNSSTCDPWGGQCDCLPGVSGRSCQYCSAYHYNYQPGIGCRACDCHTAGSIGQSCNQSTGICECQGNVDGPKCSQCVPNHYGLMDGMGCLPCGCAEGFSLSSSCNDTGHCDCKLGVGGMACEAGCLGGFFNLTSDGCQPCLCDQTGSTGISCSQDEGQCDCLETATGLICDSCPPSSYGFGPYSERGCLECLCSGHSTNCSSAEDWFLYNIVSQWSLFSFEEVPQWTGETGSGDSVLIHTRPILQVSNPRFILELEDPGTGEDLFFVSPGVYGGDRRTAYGQMLSLTLSQSEDSNRTVAPGGDVLLYGAYTEQPLVARLPHNPGTEETEYQIKLHENYWWIGPTIGGTRPDMVDVIQVLSALEMIKIRVKFTELGSGSVFLHGAGLSLASDDRSVSSDVPADFVESCGCPDQHTGQFCELCADGYSWDNPSLGPFSDCLPCDCNTHSLTPCDEQTGICRNCTHNTVGDHCERCQDGYYGNATLGTPGDCQPCMCPGLAGANSFAATCDDEGVCQGCTVGHGGLFCDFCLPGFFGVPTDHENNDGRCEPCSCSLSPAECNSTTGYCTNCTGNTAGMTCEQCRFGFFGSIDDCKDCNCSATGSIGNCTAEGECECLPNVNGTKCTSCMPDTWGFESGEGCTPCNCHPIGTVDGQTHCNLETGQCECKSGITGLRCDQCIDGFWNVDQECIACDCNMNGTDITTCTDDLCTCDQVTGQCSCSLPTIAGRQCDRCGRLDDDIATVEEVFVGHYPDCLPCPECFYNWRKTLNEQIEQLGGVDLFLEEMLSNYGNVSLEVLDERLRSTNETILSAERALGRGLDQADTLYAVQAQAQQIFVSVASLHSDLKSASLQLANLGDAMSQLGDISISPTRHPKTIISDSVASLHSDLESASAQQASLRDAISQLVDFNGSVSVSEAIVTAEGINETASLRRNTLDAIYKTANQSWFQIQRLHTRTVEARLQMEALVDEIEGGLESDLERSVQQRRDVMDARGDEQIAQEEEQNDGTISEIERIQSGYDLQSVARDLNDAGSTAQRVLSESLGALESAERELEEARALNSAAQITSYNVSRGQQLVTSVWNMSQSYKDVALSIQSNTSSAYTEMLDILSTLDESTIVLTNASRLVDMVQNYTVRPFSEMADLVSLINETHLDEGEVQVLVDDGQRQLFAAQGVHNVTKEAYHEAVAVAGHLDTIEYNLGEGQRLNQETQEGLEHLKRNISRIENVTQQIKFEADSEVAQSNILLDDTSTLIQLSQSISQCFTENVLAVRNISGRVQDSQARLGNDQQVLLTTLGEKAELDQEVSSKADIVRGDVTRIDQFNSDIGTLEQEFINIERQQSLDDMIREYQEQKRRMEGMVVDLSQMEVALDQILANLDTTDGSSLQCNND